MTAQENHTIAIASDHAAFEAKEQMKRWLLMRGHEVEDFGADSTERVDYTDYATKVTGALLSNKAERGILLCGTGLGMSYMANRFKGIRAALCWSVEAARLSRTHNDANLLVLPGRIAAMDPLEEILEAWLETPFSEEERHAHRIRMIDRDGI